MENFELEEWTKREKTLKQLAILLHCETQQIEDAARRLMTNIEQLESELKRQSTT
jgi:hypothetical protein